MVADTTPSGTGPRSGQRRLHPRDQHRDLRRRPGRHHPGAGGPAAGPADLARPGSRVPAAGQRGRRPGSVPGTPRPRSTCARLAGLSRAARDLRDRHRRPARWRAATTCVSFAAEHELPMITIADLVRYRRRVDVRVERHRATLGCRPPGRRLPVHRLPVAPATASSISRWSWATSPSGDGAHWSGCTASA